MMRVSCLSGSMRYKEDQSEDNFCIKNFPPMVSKE
jgi:hypothetical protein